jgi:hypothetical protein
MSRLPPAQNIPGTLQKPIIPLTVAVGAGTEEIEVEVDIEIADSEACVVVAVEVAEVVDAYDT